MDQSLYNTLQAYMHSCMADSAHDSEHVYRVLYNALQIAREEAPDYDVLITACLLHDIGRQDQIMDPSLCHAQVGSEKAYAYLLELGLDREFAEKVRHCIATHRFRKQLQPESLEAKILFDADKLDVTGAMGIARTLMYRGAVTESLYQLRSDGTVSDGTDPEEVSFFREYHFKLKKLYDRFYTRRGRELALERRDIAARFCENLYREINDSRTGGNEALAALLKSGC